MQPSTVSTIIQNRRSAASRKNGLSCTRSVRRKYVESRGIVELAPVGLAASNRPYSCLASMDDIDAASVGSIPFHSVALLISAVIDELAAWSAK